MPQTLSPISKTDSNYKRLFIQVQKIFIDGQRRIEAERVRTYWETGRVIYQDILKNAERADYGAQLVNNLSKDLNVDKSTLSRCVQFVKAYPKMPIVGPGQQFNWTHYRKLIPISDEKIRHRLERAAQRNAWSSKELASRIKEERGSNGFNSRAQEESKAGSVPSQKLLTPLRGKIYHYQIVRRNILGEEGKTELLIDTGFGNYLEIEPRVAAQFKEGDIVESRQTDDGYKFSKVDATPKDLYTYKARVERVIDGDTLKVHFYLGFGLRRRETLRLRGLDCSEMDTKEGQAAKTFVQSYIKEAQEIVVRSSRSDKYERYLADIFLPGMAEDKTDLYLNNLLLEKGYAKRVLS